MRFALYLFVSALVGPTVSLAGEQTPGLVAVGSRVFLAPGVSNLFPGGTLPPDAPAITGLPPQGVFLGLGDIAPVRDIMASDPLLSPYRTGIQIGWKRRPPSVRFGDEAVSEWFSFVDRVPEEIRLDDFDVRTMDGEAEPNIFNFRPTGPAPGFMMICNDYPDSPKDGAFDLCNLDATYPLDPSISLSTEMEHAPFPATVLDAPATVARMREIVACLDVTDAPPADPEAALAELLAANPRLEGCGNPLSS